jgi:hypothetical protein
MNACKITAIAALLFSFFILPNSAIAGSPDANTAVAINPWVTGGEPNRQDHATHGGNGGIIIVKTGVNVDTGDGSDGSLTHDVILTSGIYNYTQVPIESTATIFIDGDVTINCQGGFAPFKVVGVFHPDQPSPRVRVNAGHPIYTYDGGIQLELYHLGNFLMYSSESASQPAVFNSDGSGMDGGIAEFYTTEAGDIDSIFCDASGHSGYNGGNGGDGGEIIVVANSGVVKSFGMQAVGGSSERAQDCNSGNGGNGGNGGKILISGSGFVASIGGLSVAGGNGGSPYNSMDKQHRGFRGGNGGSGGAIVVSAPLCLSGDFKIIASGGNGSDGGIDTSAVWLSYDMDDGSNGLAGGDGGSGGAPGVLISISGTNTPGNGGNGGHGGEGASGTDGYPGPGGPGGDGGPGGNGGDSGGIGALPGIGGEGGWYGSGGWGLPEGPDGENGQRGRDGEIGNPAPPKPPSDTMSSYTYVLCVGTRDYDITKLVDLKYPFLDGDRSATFVCDAFNRLPNIVLTAKAIPLDTSIPNNSDTVKRAIKKAANRLRPGDNFIFHINCHADFTPFGDVTFLLSRSGLLGYPQWQYDTTDNMFTSWFSGGVWPNVHKLFIIDCCHAFGFWGTPPDIDDLSSLHDAGILAACAEDDTSVANNDSNPYLPICWGVLSQSLVRALNNLSTKEAITFDELVQKTKDMGANMALPDGVFNGVLEDPNFSTNATCVWAPVATHSSDFGFSLVPDANAFPQPDSLQITKCTVTAGKKINTDKISFSGIMGTAADDFSDPNNPIEVTIDSADIVSPCVLTFPINGKTFKKGKYSFSGTVSSLKKSFSYDAKTGKFAFSAGNIDLSGLDCPLTARIVVGDYNETAQLDETIVNGTKPIPIQLMTEIMDVLRVDKCTVKQGKKKPYTDQLPAGGAFTVEDPNMSMTSRVSAGLVITLGAQTFTIPADKLKPGKDKFTFQNAPIDEGGTATGNFNFKMCFFTLTIKNTEITATGDVDFGVQFTGFDEIDYVSLP